MIPSDTFAHWLRTLPMVVRGGWALLHSIWELAAVAGILALVLRRLADASARVRYLVTTIALALMFALPIVTFQCIGNVRVSPPGSVANAQPPVAVTASTEQLSGNLVPQESGTHRTLLPLLGTLERAFNPSWRARITERLAQATVWLIPMWGFGVLILSIWNLGGWVATQRLRLLGVRPVGPDLVRRMAEIASRVGLTRPVRLVESTLIQIPIVIGFLSPLVLVPTSIVTGLSPAHLEAILAHELAHIRRHDYLVNLLQVLVETLLFYHPAVWWVSRQIRTERENCCDDIATGICGDRRIYAEALISVEELRPPGGLLAVAATGGGRMFARIQRIIGRPQHYRDQRNAPLAAVVLSLSLLLAVLLPGRIFGQDASVKTQPPTNPASPGSVASDQTGTEFPYSIDFVPFTPQWGRFSRGDSIAIKSVRGDRKHLELGGTYLVEGTYTLASMESAGLSVSVTHSEPTGPGARSPSHPEQGTKVQMGSGGFSLRITMRYAGSFHVSFNPPGGGESRGTVYFSEITPPVPDISTTNAAEPPTQPGIVAAVQPGAVESDSQTAAAFEKAFPYDIGFSEYQKPWSGFTKGDSITVHAIRGNRRQIEVGGSYAVLGTYELTSMSNAKLGLFVTSEVAPHAPMPYTPVLRGQLRKIAKGSGTFVLWYSMTADGDPHVSFYPTDSKAEQRGGVYFEQTSIKESVASGHLVEVGQPIFKRYLDRNARVEIGDPIFKNFVDEAPGSLGNIERKPQATDSASELKPLPTMQIRIDKDETISINGKAIADEQLEALLVQAHNVDVGTSVLVVDDEVSERTKLKLVMDSCLKAGLGKINLHQSTVLIAVDKYGVISVNKWHVTDENVEPMLVQARNANGDISVVIDADETTQLDRLGFVMNCCRKAGLTKFIMQSR